MDHSDSSNTKRIILDQKICILAAHLPKKECISIQEINRNMNATVYKSIRTKLGKVFL